MLSKREFLKEEKDCAKMLGMTLDEYRESCKNVKAPIKKQKEKNTKYDNSILSFLGLSSKDLKKRKVV